MLYYKKEPRTIIRTWLKRLRYIIIICLMLLLLVNLLPNNTYIESTKNQSLNLYEKGIYPIISFKKYMEAVFHVNPTRLLELESQITELNFKISQLEYLKSENKILLDALELKNISSTIMNDQYKVARVVSIDQRDYEHKMLISTESAQLDIGDAALDQHGLIGKVIEINENLAVVMLYSHPEFRVPAQFSDPEQRAIFAGTGSKADLKLSLARDGLLIDNLDDKSVFTSGDGGLFPKGIKIGEFRYEGAKILVSRPKITQLSHPEYVIVIPKQ